MITVVVLFNLRPNITPASYEQWAAKTDLPTVGALPSVDHFRVLRSNGLLGGGNAPYQYIELIEVHDLDGLTRDIESESMQQVAAAFHQYADAPVFILAEAFALAGR